MCLLFCVRKFKQRKAAEKSLLNLKETPPQALAIGLKQILCLTGAKNKK